MSEKPPEDSIGPADPSADEPSQAEETDLLGQALEDLEVGIRERIAAGERAEDASAVDWMALFDELRRRLSALGMSERSGEVDDFGLDPEELRMARPLLEFLRRRWWRVAELGIDALPAPPLLFVANRSGILPYDGLMIAHLVAEAQSEAARPRFMVADWLMTRPFAQPRISRLGGVRACRENAERLLATGRSVIAFPEGLKGAVKVFRDRYRLRRFGRGGVVRVAIASGVPLVPVSVIGAEEAHPVLFRIETLARGIGLPFLPVTPTFPILGPLGAIPLPAKWSIRFGESIPTAHLGPDAAGDELLISRMTEELRARIQSMLEADLRARSGVFG